MAPLQRRDPRKPPLTPAQQRVVRLSQWMTDPWLAAFAVDVAGITTSTRVLEPSAGSGNIVRACLDRGARVVAVELDRGLARGLGSIELVGYPAAAALVVRRADFLEWAPAPPALAFDVAVMNPPYEDGQDLTHVLHALTLARRVVAVLRLNALAGVLRHNALWSRFDVQQILSLPSRPDFGERARAVGMPGAGAQSDFILVDVMARPRRIGSRPSFDWIRRPV